MDFSKLGDIDPEVIKQVRQEIHSGKNTFPLSLPALSFADNENLPEQSPLAKKAKSANSLLEEEILSLVDASPEIITICSRLKKAEIKAYRSHHKTRDEAFKRIEAELFKMGKAIPLDRDALERRRTEGTAEIRQIDRFLIEELVALYETERDNLITAGLTILHPQPQQQQQQVSIDDKDMDKWEWMQKVLNIIRINRNII